MRNEPQMNTDGESAGNRAVPHSTIQHRANPNHKRVPFRFLICVHLWLIPTLRGLSRLCPRHRPVRFPACTRATTPADWLRSRAPRAAGMSLNRCAITCLISSNLASLAPFFPPGHPPSEPPADPRAVTLFRPGIVRPSPARPPIPPSRLPPPDSSRGPSPSVPLVVKSKPSRSAVPRPAPPHAVGPPELASFAHS
jgi:hypothetical protein